MTQEPRLAGNAMECSGYIGGVIDGIKNNPDYPSPCIGEGVTFAQIVLIVYKYLNDHPEELHYDTPALITLALIDAFSCRGGK